MSWGIWHPVAGVDFARLGAIEEINKRAGIPKGSEQEAPRLRKGKALAKPGGTHSAAGQQVSVSAFP